MKYADFLARDHFAADELLAFANGTLVEDPPEGFTARLPGKTTRSSFAGSTPR